ncbi:MAG: hypothetical protein AB8H80_18780 [Planctomycetota bacterium]
MRRLGFHAAAAGFAAVLVGALAGGWGHALRAQNSGAKIRPPLGEMAAQAGMGVKWRKDVDSALAESKRTGKPVFWYVPAISRSPMDRKPVIDRYMMGGPFSAGSVLLLLQEYLVPVKQVAGRDELSKRLGLRRGAFIEPGYVVLDGDGKQLLQMDQITTFHADAFVAPLRRLLGMPALAGGVAGVDPDELEWLHRGDWQALAEALKAPSDAMTSPPPKGGRDPDRRWMHGVALFRSGERQRAEAVWRELVREESESVYAWKAALELENYGPFVHGFEVYRKLPEAVLARDPEDGTRAPEGIYSESDLWQRGVEFLLGARDKDGVYRDSTYDFGGTDSLPNVHAAVTCLVGEALLAATARADRGEGRLTERQRKGAEALLLQLRALAMESDWLALSDRDEILWARAYALRFLLAWRARRGDDAETIDPGIRRGAAALLTLQPETGAWFHEYSNPFAIATALQALHGAAAVGVDVPDDNVQRGLRALLRNRSPEGAYSYSQTRDGRKPRANLKGAAGRMPLCELGLYLHGESDQTKLAAAVAAGREHHGLLAEVRKYDDHASRLGYGGFFFWFDMLGRAEAIAMLEDKKLRRENAAAMHKLVLALPEIDGCFVDSHELGRCYGTAMGLLCLDVLARAQRQ